MTRYTASMPRRNTPRTREPIAVRVRPEFKIALEEYVESRRQAGEADLRVGHVMEVLLEPLLTPEGRQQVDALLQLRPAGFRTSLEEPGQGSAQREFRQFQRTYYGFEHAGPVPQPEGRYGLHRGKVYEFETSVQRDEWVAAGESAGLLRERMDATSGEVRRWVKERG